MTAQLADVDGLAVVVPAAVRAHHVRQLGLPALRADATGRRGEPPVGGPPATALGLGGLLLGDGHRRIFRSRRYAAHRAPPILGRSPGSRARSHPRCGWPHTWGTDPGSPPRRGVPGATRAI